MEVNDRVICTRQYAGRDDHGVVGREYVINRIRSNNNNNGYIWLYLDGLDMTVDPERFALVVPQVVAPAVVDEREDFIIYTAIFEFLNGKSVYSSRSEADLQSYIDSAERFGYRVIAKKKFKTKI